MVCGLIFLRPMILAMQGLPPVATPRQRARLAVPLPAGGPREHFLRARRRADGAVIPFPSQDSSLLSVLAEADCLLVQPPASPPLDVGSEVEIVPI
jgi:molybdopterin molybdotransferase